MFVPNWRQAWRWWSVRVSALGAILAAIALAAPDAIASIWNALPPELLAWLPRNVAMVVPLLIQVAAIVARMIQQPKGGTLRRLWQSTTGKVAPKAAGGIAAAIAAAVLIVTPFTATHEGQRLNPYADLGGKMTVCFGETRVAMRRYTPVECRALLTKALTSDYAPPVLACVPQLADAPYPFAASIDAAYNAGPGAFCRSRAAASFRRRDWRGGCASLIGWRDTVAGVKVRGLANRRRDQMALCMTGHPA